MTRNRKAWRVQVQEHPGSGAHDITNEPDWESGHNHRIGFNNRDHRRPGITSERDEYYHEIEEALRDQQYLADRVSAGKLINFRDVVQRQKVVCYRY